jgi:hypothetical protein
MHASKGHAPVMMKMKKMVAQAQPLEELQVALNLLQITLCFSFLLDSSTHT